MTKTIRSLAIASLLVAMASAGGVQADVVAGWDFSQYQNPGFLSINGTTNEDTLGANYSNLDSTFNLGPDSAQFGRAFFDGSRGSSNVDENAATPAIVPAAGYPGGYDGTEPATAKGAVESNTLAPGDEAGENAFNSFAALRSQGQQYTNYFGLSAQAATDVVFAAASGVSGTNWGFSFGGRAISGTSTVTVEYRPECTGGWTSLANANLDATDQEFTYNLGAGAATSYCVRLGLDNASGQPIVDNVAIEATLVPEPGTLVLLGAGVAGLAIVSRKRL